MDYYNSMTQEVDYVLSTLMNFDPGDYKSYISNWKWYRCKYMFSKICGYPNQFIWGIDNMLSDVLC